MIAFGAQIKLYIVTEIELFGTSDFHSTQRDTACYTWDNVAMH